MIYRIAELERKVDLQEEQLKSIGIFLKRVQDGGATFHERVEASAEVKSNVPAIAVGISNKVRVIIEKMTCELFNTTRISIGSQSRDGEEKAVFVVHVGADANPNEIAVKVSQWHEKVSQIVVDSQGLRIKISYT